MQRPPASCPAALSSEHAARTVAEQQLVQQRRVLAQEAQQARAAGEAALRELRHEADTQRRRLEAAAQSAAAQAAEQQASAAAAHQAHVHRMQVRGRLQQARW